MVPVKFYLIFDLNAPVWLVLCAHSSDLVQNVSWLFQKSKLLYPDWSLAILTGLNGIYQDFSGKFQRGVLEIH